MQTEVYWGLLRLSSLTPSEYRHGTLKQVTAASSSSFIRFVSLSFDVIKLMRLMGSFKFHSLYGCPSSDCEWQQPSLIIISDSATFSHTVLNPTRLSFYKRLPKLGLRGVQPSFGNRQSLSRTKYIPPLTEPIGSVHKNQPPVPILSHPVHISALTFLQDTSLIVHFHPTYSKVTAVS